jgi:hypothetical protein
MTNHTRPARSWTAPLLLLGITAAILVVFAANLLVHPGQTPVAAIGSPPSSSPTAPAAAAPVTSSVPDSAQPQPSTTVSPSPSPKPTPRPTSSSQPAGADANVAPSCSAEDLAARIVAWDGAAGSRIAEVEVRNVATAACAVGEPSALRLVAADGAVLIDSTKLDAAISTTPGAPAVTVAPGTSIRTDVRVANYCGAMPKGSIGVSITLPHAAGVLRAMPAAGVSSADAVPPCNGPIGPEIEMNGWQA